MKVLITDFEFAHVDLERKIFRQAGIELAVAQCRTEEEVVAAGRDADGLLVHWAPISQKVLQALEKCRVIVRYGVGIDNIDLKAAADRGIPACNVPDYSSGEVADHTLALALTLARQLPLIDKRMRDGVWKITPDFSMPCFRDMRFVTLGFGRIAREVLHRAASFGFQLAAYDPFVSAAIMREQNVSAISLEEALETSDILSLHSPLNAKTHHLLGDTAFRRMKPGAIILNTARGGLIDLMALATALNEGRIFASGLDVYEDEPLAPDHPIRRAPRTLLTSHIAWYSDASEPRLHRMAAEEVIRGLRGEPLHSQMNLPR